MEEYLYGIASVLQEICEIKKNLEEIWFLRLNGLFKEEQHKEKEEQCKIEMFWAEVTLILAQKMLKNISSSKIDVFLDFLGNTVTYRTGEDETGTRKVFVGKYTPELLQKIEVYYELPGLQVSTHKSFGLTTLTLTYNMLR